MRIGIDASRAFLKQRTGIEEYSYQVVKHLRDKLDGHQVILYIPQSKKKNQIIIDFSLPANWKIKTLNYSRFWTQIGLSLEMLRHPVEVLFIPAHIIPIIHPAKTVVTVHGLEYEIKPEAYSYWERFYMHQSIKRSCFWAQKIIAVSRNTQKDLHKIYKVPIEKIEVVYEGINNNLQSIIPKSQIEKKITSQMPYVLFVGRLEKRKNIEGIIQAFEWLKKRYQLPHKLILAGKSGFGYNQIRERWNNSPNKKDIILTGFVSEEKKITLMKSATVFLFPTFYEGFGLPILEAQSLGIPVVTSNISSLPEVGQQAVAYCEPDEPLSIADTLYKVISQKEYRDDIIKAGYINVKKFSWDKCAQQIAEILIC